MFIKKPFVQIHVIKEYLPEGIQERGYLSQVCYVIK